MDAMHDRRRLFPPRAPAALTALSRGAVGACLILAVLIFGVALAQTRGQAPAVGQVALCLGDVTRMVAIDANGKPTAPPHLCGDCVFHFVADLAAPADLPVARGAGSAWPASLTRAVWTGRGAARVRVRGPPDSRPYSAAA